MDLKKNVLKIIAVFVPLAVGAALAASRFTPVSGQQEISVPEPSHWVPFSALSRHVVSSGRVFVGRYFRASDGSTRYESGPSLDEVTAIGINNVSRATHCRWVKGSAAWVQQPMQLPRDGFVPSVHRYRGAELLTEKVEGLDIVRLARGHLVMIHAPALNFFVVAQTINNCEGKGTPCEDRYYDINIGEPPAELFELPAGVTPTILNTPGGIVRRGGR